MSFLTEAQLLHHPIPFGSGKTVYFQIDLDLVQVKGILEFSTNSGEVSGRDARISLTQSSKIHANFVDSVGRAIAIIAFTSGEYKDEWWS